MLRLVGDDRRPDRDEFPPWPETRGDRSGGADSYRHLKRRSVVGRVALTVALAVALMSAGVAAYLAGPRGATSGVLGGRPPVLASQPAAVPLARDSSRTPPAVRATIPGVEGLVVLIRNAVVALHQANAAGDYSVLREIAAPGFQQANSPAGLSEAFADLRSRSLDLGQIAVVNPRLVSEPTIDPHGLLHLVGFFAVGPRQVNFDLVFQAVREHWRLFAIAVDPQKPQVGAADGGPMPKPPTPTAATLPDSAIMIALIRSSIMALNQANTTGDYSVLREIAAPGFQEANDVAKLGTLFAELRARQLDLAPIAVIDPRLFRAAAIDAHGYLRLTGYFPSQPEQVNFDLAFQFVQGQWRIFGIGVNTSRDAPAAMSMAPPKEDGKAVASNSSGAIAPEMAQTQVEVPRAPGALP